MSYLPLYLSMNVQRVQRIVTGQLKLAAVSDKIELETSSLCHSYYFIYALKKIVRIDRIFYFRYWSHTPKTPDIGQMVKFSDTPKSPPLVIQ